MSTLSYKEGCDVARPNRARRQGAPGNYSTRFRNEEELPKKGKIVHVTSQEGEELVTQPLRMSAMKHPQGLSKLRFDGLPSQAIRTLIA